MGRYIIATALLFACAPNATHESAEGSASGGGEREAGTIAVSATKCVIGDKTLELCYQITNGSNHDIWICESMDLHRGHDIEVYVGEDNQTLFVQRRLDVPMLGSREQPIGRYVRVRHGETRTETISLSLPVHCRWTFFGKRSTRPPEQATRLVLEIGYYEGDLPATIFRLLEEAETSAAGKAGVLPAYGTGLRGMLGGPTFFDELNRNLRDRDEQLMVPWTDQALKGEKLLQMKLENLRIPYSDQYIKVASIHLSPLKRIKVHFRQSPLEFLFPYAQQQALLSPEEKRYLQSLKDFTLEDERDLMGIAYDASEARSGVFFTERSTADLTCYRKDGSVISLVVCDDAYILTSEGQVFRCLNGLTRLRMLTPQIQSFDVRIGHARDLKNLWYRFRLYYISRHVPRNNEEFWGRYLEHGYVVPPDALRTGERMYPSPNEWCNVIATGERPSPGAGEDECRYAMNPDCKSDSSGDTVLLFEAKGGWNRRGGPELFTFDNHDPKGGCVLLNDGTVKFIRTEEELKLLRWK